MKNRAIKEKQIEKEIINYLNYDFENFDDLNNEEKIFESERINNILFERRMSEEFYIRQFANVPYESQYNKRIMRMKRKLFKINTLVDILEEILDQIDNKILFIEKWRL